MVRDITIGQYYPTESIIHRLDPRVKLFATLIYIVSLFLFDSFYGYLAAGAYLITLIALSRVSIRYIVKGLKAIVFLLLITVVFNLFLTPGEDLFRWKFISITKEGVRTASFMGIRLLLLIIGSSMLTYTTTPNSLTDGMERAFAPLKLFRVPVHEMAMMMSIALRFIPILLEETDKIMKAQQARGADFESGGLFRRAKAMIPILVPLFVSAFRRAGDLALAMEARCYRGGKGRTKMKPLRYRGRDFLTYVLILVYLSGIIFIKNI